MRRHHSHWPKTFLVSSLWLAFLAIIFLTDPQFLWAKLLFFVFLFGSLLTTFGKVIALTGTIFTGLAYFHLANPINFLILLALALIVKYNWRRG